MTTKNDINLRNKKTAMNTNQTSPIGRPALQHIRLPRLSVVILLGLFCYSLPAWATPPEWAAPLKENVVASRNKIRSRVNDLNQIARGLRGLDREMTREIAHSSERPVCELDHIRELLTIDSLVQNENDASKRIMIESMISGHLDSLGEYVDIAVEYINGAIANLDNQAAILAGGKLTNNPCNFDGDPITAS
jgi:hypothetical protein